MAIVWVEFILVSLCSLILPGLIVYAYQMSTLHIFAIQSHMNVLSRILNLRIIHEFPI